VDAERARRDSNTRPLAPQASALSKLSYERKKNFTQPFEGCAAGRQGFEPWVQV
jgi:hypothetical protein